MKLKITELLDKVDNFEKLTQKEQVKLISYFFCLENSTEVFQPFQVNKCFELENLRPPANISNEFIKLTNRKPPIFIKKGSGYSFERSAKRKLDFLYLGTPNKQIISTTLRDLVPKLSIKEQQVFLEEAICCFEIKSYRASVVMTWLLAVDIIYEYVIKYHLINFNNAIQTHGKYKKIAVTHKDHFSEIKESDFIELLRLAKIVSNDKKKILDEKLNFRNTCAHPNSITIKETKAISFIEDLIENIITKF